MQFGITVPNNYEFRDDFSNIGDHIQAYCIRQIYREMGIDDIAMRLIDKAEMIDNAGATPSVIPICSYVPPGSVKFRLPYYKRNFAVTLGISFAGNTSLPEETIDWLKGQQPIACRDEETVHILEGYKLEAFLFGCLTATLPKRTDISRANKIFLVDLPESFLKYLPTEIAESPNVIRISHLVNPKLSPDNYLKMAEEYLNNYKINAKLVITSRLHCASPCMAMGIPVVFITDNRSGRLGWIDKLLPVYTPSKWSGVKYDVAPADFESTKKKMISFAKKRLREVYDKYTDIADVDAFWKERPVFKYNNFIEDTFYRECPDLGNEFEFIIWGLGSVGHAIYNFLINRFPESKLVCAVDRFLDGDFYGVEISRPDNILLHPQAFIFAATHTGKADVDAFMDKHNKIYGRDYINLDTMSG